MKPSPLSPEAQRLLDKICDCHRLLVDSHAFYYEKSITVAELDFFQFRQARIGSWISAGTRQFGPGFLQGVTEFYGADIVLAYLTAYQKALNENKDI